MRIIVWLVRIAFFLVLLGFALENTAPLTVNLFLGYYLEAPLVVFLLGLLLAGVVLGVLIVVPSVIRMRRQIRRLKRELEARALHALPQESEAAAAPR